MKIFQTQIKARPTRCSKGWFIDNHLFLSMFRASLLPSSGEQTACHYVVLSWLWLLCLTKQYPPHSAHISLPDSPEPQQSQPGQNTIGSDTQSALLMMGVKTPETCWGTIDCQ